MCPAATAQAALSSSQDAFNSCLRFAEPSAAEAAWRNHKQQCEQSLSMAVERIRRQQAEEQLSFTMLLQAAKASAQQAFDERRFTDRAYRCSTELAVAEVFEVRGTLGCL